MRHVRTTVEDAKATTPDKTRVRHTLVFDSPHEAAKMVVGVSRTSPRTLWPLSGSFADSARDAVKWFGRADIRSWDGVGRAVNEVWGPGADRVETLLGRLEGVRLAVPRDIRRRPAWREDSGAFDFDRYMVGQPAFRGAARRDVVGRQFLTVVIDLCAGHKVEADKMYWRAAVGIAAAAKLEEFGYGVEIVGVANTLNAFHPAAYAGPNVTVEERFGFRGNRMTPGGIRYVTIPRKNLPGPDQDVFTVVRCKGPDDPLDVGTLAAAASPWFYRLVMFGAWCLVPGVRPYAWLGEAVRPEPAQLDEYAAGAGERVVIGEVWDEAGAGAVLQDTVNRFADRDVTTEGG